MKNTEIVTSHNVVIQYELASAGQRILASLLDGFLVYIYLVILLSLAESASVGQFFERGYKSDDTAILVIFILMIPGAFYSFWMESLFGGRTLGKMVLGIKVVNINGDTPRISDYMLRWVMRIVEIIGCFGGIALLSVMANDRMQRLGDLVANTMVIRLNPSKDYSIVDILNIKSTKDYQPTYPSVVQFTDEDMLIVKNSLERLKKNPNKAHKRLVKEVYEKMVSLLNIEQPPQKKVAFLRTVLQDYIVLTRS